MIIVGGTLEFDPEQREEFLLGRHDAMRKTRAEAGCFEYTLSADPIDPGRVVIFERWESQEAFDTHISSSQASRQAHPAVTVAPKTSSIVIYDVGGERPFGA